MPRRSLLLFAAVIFFATISRAAEARHKSHAAVQTTEEEQYVETVSELTGRARANVYFPNPQSIFNGVQVNFVNAGKGNLTFLRRDIVTSGAIPLVFARAYDSSSTGTSDFGPGWILSAAEQISLRDDKAELLTERGDLLVFARSGDQYVLAKEYPSDYRSLVLKTPDTITAQLRTGFTKEFQRIGNCYRVIRVSDQNGNQVQLTYLSGLLSRMENGSHSIEIARNDEGRIIAATDDQGRKV